MVETEQMHPRRHLRAIPSDPPHIVHADPGLLDAPQSAGEDRIVAIKGGQT